MSNSNLNRAIFKRNMSIDYFRVFLMFLVVWHHATLAYSTTGAGVLIADDNTFIGFDLIALYNDSFFMFAFFFISGLFAYKSLLKKNAKTFLKERSIRLLLPFAFGTLLINPIAHYFSFLNKSAEAFSIRSYFQFLVHHFGKTDANHLWFLWVLFFFSLMLVVYHQIQKKLMIPTKWQHEKYLMSAWRFSIVMIVLGFLFYLPMQNIDSGGFVTLIKPFNMQISRILLYFLYFVAGNVVGIYDIKKCFLLQEKFQKKWWLWVMLSLVMTFLNLVVHIVRENMGNSVLKNAVIVVDQSMIIVISLLALYGFLSFFTLYIKGESRVMNMLAKESMGIYVIHYAVVTGLQYMLTFVELSGAIKGAIVAMTTVVISLGLVRGLKRVPAIGVVFGKAYNLKYDRGLVIITIAMLLLLIFL